MPCTGILAIHLGFQTYFNPEYPTNKKATTAKCPVNVFHDTVEIK